MWPIFAAIIFFFLRDFLRDHLLEIIRLVKTVRFPGGEVAFKEAVDDLRAQADRVQLPSPEAQSESKQENKDYLELAGSSPTVAILQDWGDVEKAVGELLDKHKIQHPADKPLPSLAPVRDLYRLNAIDMGTLGIIHQLRRVRNEVVHTPDRAVTLGEALLFHQLAQSVMAKLRELGSGPSSKEGSP